MTQTLQQKRWFASLLIGIVLFLNLQAAVQFIANPQPYLHAYELTGLVGRIVIQSTGILFLMWNIPYVFACWHPIRYRVSLLEAIIMQTIGLVGETLLWLDIPAQHAILKSSIERFILFDSLGWALLILATWLVHRAGINHKPVVKPANAHSTGG